MKGCFTVLVILLFNPISMILWLALSAEVEGRKPEYKSQIVSGEIVSNGVIECSRSVTGPVDPVVMVKCDDGIMVEICVLAGDSAAGYKLTQGERVKVKRRKTMALIPFLTDRFKAQYEGWLQSSEEAS